MMTTSRRIIRRAMTKLTAACVVLLAMPLCAQDDFEIQVYGSDTVAKGATMVELHSNFTSHRAHETVEITQGLTTWFETGFYIFTSGGDGNGWQYAGSHIRPRVRVPEDWHWPVGVSLSTEIGYVKRPFSDDPWSWEIRPIIDKEIGKLYVSFNPAFERSQFSPALNIKYDVTPVVAAGIEYYAQGADHQYYPSIDLNVSPDWEFNAGIGFSRGPTLVKFIVGRRFHR
jgi:hypothetical protein